MDQEEMINTEDYDSLLKEVEINNPCRTACKGSFQSRDSGTSYITGEDDEAMKNSVILVEK